MKILTINGNEIPNDLRTLPVVTDQNNLIQRGFIVVDKPAGMTSHDVVDSIRRIYGIRKVGHAGTLDPMVTGVLPIGIGEGTKLLRFLLESGKISIDCLYKQTRDVLIDEDTIIVNTKRQTVESDQLKIDQIVLAMGYIDIEGNLLAKRISKLNAVKITNIVTK